MFITVQIDLTAIGKLLRENPDLAKKVSFKDGEHQLLNLAIGDKKEPKDRFDLNVNCKPKDAPFDTKWYVGTGCSNPGGKNNPAPNPQPSAPSPMANAPVGDSQDSDLPF